MYIYIKPKQVVLTKCIFTLSPNSLF